MLKLLKSSKNSNLVKRLHSEVDDSILDVDVLSNSTLPPTKKSRISKPSDSELNESKPITQPIQHAKKNKISKNQKSSNEKKELKSSKNSNLVKRLRSEVDDSILDVDEFSHSPLPPTKKLKLSKPLKKSKVVDIILSYDVGIVNLAEAILIFYEDGFEIVHLKQINLIKENGSKVKNSKHLTTEKLTNFMIDYLHKNTLPLIEKFKPTKILIERQPGLNRKITTLGFVLKSFFHSTFLFCTHLKKPEIRFKDPKLKLSVFASHFLNSNSRSRFQSESEKQTFELMNGQVLSAPKKKNEKQKKEWKKTVKSKYRQNKKHAVREVDLLMDHYPGCTNWNSFYKQLGSKRDDIGDCILQACQEHDDWILKKSRKKIVQEDAQERDEKEEEKEKNNDSEEEISDTSDEDE